MTSIIFPENGSLLDTIPDMINTICAIQKLIDTEGL